MTVTPDFTVHFEERPGYLYAFVNGHKDSLEVSKRFWAQIHATAVELDSKRVIVEEDFPNQLSTMEIFEIAEFVTKTFRYNIKIAHVDRKMSDMQLNRFAETVAVNRCCKGRVFNKLDDAEKWIFG
jgi:hypothetical protein